MIGPTLNDYLPALADYIQSKLPGVFTEFKSRVFQYDGKLMALTPDSAGQFEEYAASDARGNYGYLRLDPCQFDYKIQAPRMSSCAQTYTLYGKLNLFVLFTRFVDPLKAEFAIRQVLQGFFYQNTTLTLQSVKLDPADALTAENPDLDIQAIIRPDLSAALFTLQLEFKPVIENCDLTKLCNELLC